MYFTFAFYMIPLRDCILKFRHLTDRIEITVSLKYQFHRYTTVMHNRFSKQRFPEIPISRQVLITKTIFIPTCRCN